MSGTVTIIPVTGIGEVVNGDDCADVLEDAISAMGEELHDGDVVVVTHKIVSKAEGRVAPVADDAAYRSLVDSEAAAILRRRGDLRITRTSHGFICANAGVDRSNVEAGYAVLLPVDPDRSAYRIHTRLALRWPVEFAVLVTDTFGRPWRRGLTDVAIGVSGMEPVTDLRGTEDMHGRVLDVTEVATADEIAAAADIAMGKASGIPAAIVRGAAWLTGEGRAVDMIRSADEDLFR